MNMDKFAEQTVQWFWLEEMPLAELPNSDVQDIVTAYRCGTLWSEEALNKLKEECSQEISSWISTNQELSSIFSGEEGEGEV